MIKFLHHRLCNDVHEFSWKLWFGRSCLLRAHCFKTMFQHSDIILQFYNVRHAEFCQLILHGAHNSSRNLANKFLAILTLFQGKIMIIV